MSRVSGRRGLTVVLVVLALLAGVMDLLRPQSFILAAWRKANHRDTPMERAVKEFERTRALPIPRSNRVEPGGSQRDMAETQAASPG